MTDPVAPAPAPVRQSWLRRAATVAVWGGVALIIAGGGIALAGYIAYERVTGKGASAPGPAVRVTVPEGASGKDIGALLREQGLVDHEFLFRLAIRLDTVRRPIQAGLYAIPSGLSPSEILRLLQNGPNARRTPEEIPAELKVSAPEGLSIAQMSNLFPNPDAFVAATRDATLIARLGIAADSLEGFLMPNTYYFDKPPTEREVVERMTLQFQKTYAQVQAEIPGAADKDLFETVIVASLVEEEAKVDEERPLIAAVIYNRLARNMPLGIDATLQYALGKYGQRMLDSDKEIDSPYNTYKHAGLPPGPISNPGTASLRAALRPAEVKHLYFVSNADGRTHAFSATLEEHTRAVARFRKEIAAQRREQKNKERSRDAQATP